MQSTTLKDYYNTLDCTIDSSYREIYLKFKKLSFPLHPDNSNSHENKSLFIEYCEAYYVLEYPEFREIYDELYKGYFLNESIDLSEELTNRYLDAWRKDGPESGEKFLEMPFKKFKRKIPYKESWTERIFGGLIHFIWDVFS